MTVVKFVDSNGKDMGMIRYVPFYLQLYPLVTWKWTFVESMLLLL